MARTSPPAAVKLFLVTLHSGPLPMSNAIDLVKNEYGNTDFESEDFPFTETTYYENEMGTNLVRRFFSFEKLIEPDRIVEAKLFCNHVENEYSTGSNRAINLDPGYLDTYKVVLASAKFGGQKIYLRDGIYADMTLTMYKGKWVSFLWGFPDFKSGKYDAVLCKIRDLYKKQRLS